MWIRIAHEPEFHAIASVGDYLVLSHCGRFLPGYDAVESLESPPRRCSTCERSLLARTRIDVCLRELVAVAP